MKKRSVKIDGHATSVTLEDEFWAELQRQASARDLSINKMIAEIDSARREDQNLSSAVRVFILQALQEDH